jgi:hypothetical protein
MSAPAAVSTSRRAFINYRSVVVNGRQALQIHASVPICEIGNDSKYGNGLHVQSLTSTPIDCQLASLNPYQMVVTGNTSTYLTAPAQASWVSPHVPLLATAFDRYQADSLVFHYEPQSTSTVSDRLVFAWCEDPLHPFLSANGAYGFGTSTSLTQLQQLVTADSVAFMPWKPWSLKCPVSRDIKYLYDTNTGDETQTRETSSARFTEFGSFSCVASAVGGDPIQYGVLYAEVILTLIDPVPIIQKLGAAPGQIMRMLRSRPAVPVETKAPIRRLPADDDLSIRVKRERGANDDSDIIRREPDDDWTTPSPPTFTPAPSVVPGSPAYAPALRVKIPSKK